jgi:hypothetical protein
MASSRSGKGVDYTSEWSEWAWHKEGFWFSSRYGPDGEIEYDYDKTTPPPASWQERESTPRFSGENNVQSVSSPFGSPSDITPEFPSYTTTQANSTKTQVGNVKFAKPLTIVSSSKGKYYDGRIPQSSQPWIQETSAESSSERESDPLPASLSGNQDYPSLEEVTAGLEHLSLAPSATYPAGSHSNFETQAQRGSTDESASAETRHGTLDPRYKVIETKKLGKFWRVGRVFMMLWVEPARDFAPQPKPTSGPMSQASQYGTAQASSETGSWLGGSFYSEIRRFVVLGTNYGNAQCSPIHTYGYQACLKPSLPDVNQHTIIYTSEYPPNERSYIDEKGVERFEGLSKTPIRVVSERKDPEGDLGERSRLNYSKVYTVEFYSRVLNIGMVHGDHLETLTANSLVKKRVEPPEGPKHRNSSHRKGPGRGQKSKGGP